MPTLAQLFRGLLCVALGAAAILCQAGERAIDKEVIIKATLEQAWASWTTRAGITAFFAPDALIEPQVGGAFQIYMDPGAEAGQKGADEMRFMALQPHKMLSFDWNAPPHLPEVRRQRSFVILRFEPVDANHTRVRLHHTGWGDGGEWDKAFNYFDRAWGNVLGNLQQRYELGPKDWTEWLAQLERWRSKTKADKAAAAASAATPQSRSSPAL
ncbi:MAG: SRPBCC domain-containing protein [Paucibacter sp.]|nr:SRPBCC domain-containing protein [Roseateles sp.]